MADCVPPAPPTENQALGPRLSLYRSFFLVLALHGGAIVRAPTKLRLITRWLSMDRRSPAPEGDGQIREDTPPEQVAILLDPEQTAATTTAALHGGAIMRAPTQLRVLTRWFSMDRRRVPILLDPEKVAATTGVIRAAILHGKRSITSLTQRRAESSDSDSSGGDDDDDEIVGHPNDQHILFPSIESLDAGDARLFFVPGSVQRNGVSRLSDVHDNPWILKAGTETFPGPCELTNERTRTWIMRLIITTKLVVLIKQQLHEQNWEQCFSEVAGQPLEQLLVVACLFSDATWSDVHISQMLTVFDTLVDVLSNIQVLHFSRSGEVAGIVNKMVDAFKGVIQRSSNVIRSSKECTIHPATFVFIQVLDFFCRNRVRVQSILESGDYNTGPCSDMFDCLISKLKECAETKFQEKGQRCIFALNNMYYVFQKNCHPGLLPPNVLSKLDSLIKEYTVSYLTEYWIPLVQSYLEGDSLNKPRHSSMDKFKEEFRGICVIQGTWKVQTKLKGILREEIVKLMVPKYVNFLKALQESRRSSLCPSLIKGMWRGRSEKPMTAELLEEVIRDLFER